MESTESGSSSREPAGPSYQSEPRGAVPREDEITLLELLVTLSRGRGLIVISVLGFGLLGAIYSLSVPTEYTADAKVVREGGESEAGGLPGGLGGISQSLGINIGGGGTGLTPSSYPAIATSREVRLQVARDTFYFPSVGRERTFVEHVNRPATLIGQILEYSVYLPWTLKSVIGTSLSSSDTRPAGTDSTGTVIYPTEEEEKAIQALEGMVNASIEQSGALEEGSGLMSISTTTENPVLAARLNESVIRHLRLRVREIRTETTRENLRFVRNRFEEASDELSEVEKRLANFLERNKSVLTGGSDPTLEFRREQLRREVSFKEQLYSNLQGQLTQTRLELQKEQPVITVAERPTPPSSPSAPNRTLNVVLSLFLGGLFGIGGAFLRSSFQNEDRDEESRAQLDEVRNSWTFSGILKAVRAEIWGEK